MSLWRGVKSGAFSGAAVAALLVLMAGHGWVSFGAVLFSALIGTLNILMIIFGAVFLYNVMEQKGYVAGISAVSAGTGTAYRCAQGESQACRPSSTLSRNALKLAADQPAHSR